MKQSINRHYSINPMRYVDIVSEVMHRLKKLDDVDIGVKPIRENLNAALLYLFNFISKDPLYDIEITCKLLYNSKTNNYYLDLINWDDSIPLAERDYNTKIYNIDNIIAIVDGYKYVCLKVDSSLLQVFGQLYPYRDSIAWLGNRDVINIALGGSISAPPTIAKFKELVELIGISINPDLKTYDNIIFKLYGKRLIELDNTTEDLPIQHQRVNSEYYNFIDVTTDYNEVLIDIVLMYVLRETNLQYYQSQSQIVTNHINNIMQNILQQNTLPNTNQGVNNV